MALLQATTLVSSCYRQAQHAHLILRSIERSMMERVVEGIKNVDYDFAQERNNDAQEADQREETMGDLDDLDSLVVDEPETRQAVVHESEHAVS